MVPGEVIYSQAVQQAVHSGRTTVSGVIWARDIQAGGTRGSISLAQGPLTVVQPGCTSACLS